MKNESGQKLTFGKTDEVNLVLQDTNDAELNGFESSVIRFHNHAETGVNASSRTPLGDANQLGFELAGIQFDAPTRISSIHHCTSTCDIHIPCSDQQLLVRRRQ